MANKFYAVRKGLVPGIYKTWDECKSNVNKFPGAEFHSFATEKEAKNYMKPSFENKTPIIQLDILDISKKINTSHEKNEEKNDDIQLKDVGYSYVDGSFNIKTMTYGYGGYLEFNGKKEIIQGSGNEKSMAIMRNVAGEILGSAAAVKKSIELKLKEVNIYYDYLGIEMWATDVWRRNKKETKDYYDYMQLAQKQIKINFIKVLAHSGVKGNEEADILAKQAVGILQII